MDFVVDIQAFYQPENKFVVKEIAILRLGTNSSPAVYTFKPPFDWEKLPVDYRVKNTWLERHYLKIK